MTVIYAASFVSEYSDVDLKARLSIHLSKSSGRYKILFPNRRKALPPPLVRRSSNVRGDNPTYAAAWRVFINGEFMFSSVSVRRVAGLCRSMTT